jgi:hypothetical protein
VESGVVLCHLDDVKTFASKSAYSNGVEADLRKLRATGRRIAANKSLSLRLLAATGMYTLKGKLKPQFR